MNILISTSSFANHSSEPLDLLKAWGANYRLNPEGRKLSEEEILPLLDEIDGLIAGTEPLTRAVLSQASCLKVISRCGTGLDNVDLDAAAELGIEVRNTPDAHVDAVAELTLAAILNSLRQITAADRAIRERKWQKPMGRLLRDQTVGLVGLGRVGRRLLELLMPFNVTFLATDLQQDLELAQKYAVRYTDLDTLLRHADIVSLHIPYTASVRNLIDAPRLRMMKQGSLLINCARGGIVDEEALRAVLQDGHLAAAHIDTFESEPYVGPLTELPNVTMSPHIGSYAVEGRIRMEKEAVLNLINCLDHVRRQP